DHLVDPEIEQNLRADAVFDEPLLAGAPSLPIKIARDRIRPRFADQHDHAASLPGDDFHGLVDQGLAAVAGADHVLDGVERMHAYQNRPAARDIAFDEGDMLGGLDRGGIDPKLEFAAIGADDPGRAHDLDQ